MFRIRRRYQVPPQLSLDKIKREARILLIDDQPWPYKDLLDREGYNVSQVPEPENLSDLVNERFSLIILDVQGVASRLGQGTTGIDILQYIKAQNPLKPVILYSSASLEMDGVKGAALADRVHKKSDGFPEFKADIDDLLVASGDPGRYLAAVNARMGAMAIAVPELSHEFVAALNAKDTRRLRRYLESHAIEADIVRDVIAIVGIAIGLFT